MTITAVAIVIIKLGLSITLQTYGSSQLIIIHFEDH